MFPLFLKRAADVLAPRLSVVFRWLVHLGSFLACWRQANVTPIPKGPPSSSVANYQPISITSVLSKVFERLVSVHLGWFMECSGVLPTTQFAYQKGLGTCDALLFVSHIHCKVHWREGRRLGSYRLISAQPLIGSTIREFCISSVLWVLEVPYCLYWHSFYQINHSMLWLMVVLVNWLMSGQECRRAVFWANYCSSYTPLSLFPFLKISWSAMPMTPLW